MIRVLGLVAVLTVSAVVGARVAASRTIVHRGCPAHFGGRDLRGATADNAIAVARRVVLGHVIENAQGHAIRRTRASYPVIQVVSLETVPALPGQAALARRAARRCAGPAARSSWAVVFTDTESVMCCIRDVRFVIRLRSGWWVY